MKRAMTGIEIYEMTPNGLQLVVELPAAEASYDEEAWGESISDMTQKIYANDKLWLATPEVGFALNNMKDKTFVVKGTFEMFEKETD